MTNTNTPVNPINNNDKKGSDNMTNNSSYTTPSAIIPAKGLEDYRAAYNSNFVVLGPSGCGKSTGVVIPSVLSMKGNYIVTDVKGSLSKLLTPRLKEAGYDVKTLDFCKAERSCNWNPLDDIGKDENGKFDEQDIMKIASEICPIETDDPYWDITARNVIESLIALAMESEEPERRSLSTVEEYSRLLGSMLKNPNAILHKAFAERGKTDHDSFAFRKYVSYRDITGVDRTWGCIIISVQKALAGFSSKGFRKMFGGHDDELSYKKLCTTKSCLFVNISDVSRDADRVVGLFYNSLFRNLFNIADERTDGRLPIPMNIILDDFASSFRIENFPGIISTVRSRNIAVSLAFQSITMLDDLYGSYSARTILNNCSIIYFGGHDPETASFISQVANKPMNVIMDMPTDKVYVLGLGHPAIYADKEKPTKYLELLAEAEKRASEKAPADENASSAAATPSTPEEKSEPEPKPAQSEPPTDSAEKTEPRRAVPNTAANAPRARAVNRAGELPRPVIIETPSSLVAKRTMADGSSMYSFCFTTGFNDDGSPTFGSVLIDASKVNVDIFSGRCTIDLGIPAKTYALRVNMRRAGTIRADEIRDAYIGNRERYIEYIKARSSNS